MHNCCNDTAAINIVVVPIYVCCLQILEAASKLANSGWEYDMEASFIEVYNETLRDLLGEGRNPREPGKVLDNNAIKHMADGTHAVLMQQHLST